MKFLIHNRSRVAVSIGDLRITIPPGKTIDLLKNKIGITLEQIETSYKSGSIFKKKDKLFKVEEPPNPFKLSEIQVSKIAGMTDNPIGYFSKNTSVYNDVFGEDVNISDDEFIKKLIEEEQMLWNPHERKKEKK
jgi:hypothetical protein